MLTDERKTQEIEQLEGTIVLEDASIIDANTNIKANYIRNKVLIIISIAIFIMAIIYGIFKLFDSSYARGQAILIIFESCVGIGVTFLPSMLFKFCKIKLSFLIRLIIQMFTFLAIILGEVFLFYYKLVFWDIFLHAFSGAGITLIGYCIARNLLKSYNMRNGYFYAIVIGIMLSLSCAILWELAEFIIDEAFNTNMQKYIPELGTLFNGGNSNIPLNGTDLEIAEFYRYKSGYKYALMDTMEDLVVCIFGTGLFAVVSSLIYKKHPKAFENMIEITKKEIVNA